MWKSTILASTFACLGYNSWQGDLYTKKLDLAEWLERLTANAKVAIVLGLSSSDIVENNVE
jgi:hypothetical protein